ncbi:CopG family transcriptional regulator [Clostridium minihomine]|uniref:CopG family transcriptional regulator n=1 Tax=Clostridium minihomine TaxID=2045012 RepID=UPI000C76B2A4|nr:CopG family transcriptional regulator [Clostridium minihomine]
MSPRTGRPKVDNPKNVEVKVRFVEGVNQKLLDYCQRHNITRAEAVRRAVDLLLSDEK